MIYKIRVVENAIKHNLVFYYSLQKLHILNQNKL